MGNIVERGFFSIVHKIGFIFALVSLVFIVFLGMFAYEKISNRATDNIITPTIELAKYQNPISLEVKNSKPESMPDKFNTHHQSAFNLEFDQHLASIVNNLKFFPKDIISQDDLQFKIKVAIKIKASNYSPILKIAYVKSLVKLTKQLVNVGGNQVDIKGFLSWYDREFSQQVAQQTQQNLMRIGLAKNNQMTGFVALGVIGIMLGFFMIFVMMLVMLRIEKNTRNKI